MPVNKSYFSLLTTTTLVLITGLFISVSTTSMAAPTSTKGNATNPNIKSVKLQNVPTNLATQKTAPVSTTAAPGLISVSDALCSFSYINYSQCTSDCKENRSDCRDISDDIVDEATADLDDEGERIAGLIADCVEECEEPVVFDGGCDGFWDCLFNGSESDQSFSNPNCDSQCTEQYQSDLDQLEDDYAALEDAAETLDDICNNIYEICVDNCACDHLSESCPDPDTGKAPECGSTGTLPTKKPGIIDFVGKNKFKIKSKKQKPLNNYRLNEELKQQWQQNYKPIKSKTSTAPIQTLRKK